MINLNLDVNNLINGGIITTFNGLLMLLVSRYVVRSLERFERNKRKGRVVFSIGRYILLISMRPAKGGKGEQVKR